MNSKGMTLIETLVVAVILGFLALAGAQMMATQMRGQAQILQKAEATDLKNQLSLILGDPNNCLCQFDSKTFDDAPTHTADGGSIPSPAMTALTKSCSGAKPILIAANTPYETSQTGLVVKSIDVVNIKTTGTANQYTANLRVYWDEKSTLSTYQPVMIPLLIQTKVGEPANAQKVLTCGGTNLTVATVCTSLGGHWDNPTQKCSGIGGSSTNTCNDQAAPPPNCVTYPVYGVNQTFCDPVGSCTNTAVSCPCGGAATGTLVCGVGGWTCVGNSCSGSCSGGDDGDGGN